MGIGGIGERITKKGHPEESACLALPPCEEKEK